MSSPEYRDVTADKDDKMAQDSHALKDGHNASHQKHVEANLDPALDISHEHQHQHLHHSSHAVHSEEVSYTKGTTDEPSTVPRADAMDNAMLRRHIGEKGSYEVQDAEKADMSPEPMEEEDPRHHTFSNLYRRFRPFVHLFIFLLFTGSVHSIYLSNFNQIPIVIYTFSYKKLFLYILSSRFDKILTLVGQ